MNNQKKYQITCLNWGHKYSADYVYNLYKMVARNFSEDFDFFCLTDQPEIYNHPIIPIKLLPGCKGWWNKMQLFNPDVLPHGEYLYFDLDVVIVADISPFFTHKGFGISRDFINPDAGLTGGREYNSSVMKFTPNDELWSIFNDHKTDWEKIEKQIPFFGDQNIISEYLNHQNFNNPFPDDWTWSFKMGTERGLRPIDHSNRLGSEIPANGIVCVFHGSPNPDEVSIDWVREAWTGMPSSQQDRIIQSVSVDEEITNIRIKNMTFTVPNHWFWPRFNDEWEPSTLTFFERHINSESELLDIGGWVGPTALLATALGSKSVTVVEPNPQNFLHLIKTQLTNKLIEKWEILNFAVSNTIGRTIVGPINLIENSSSASNIRNQNTGAHVFTLPIKYILESKTFSLIKIDIEGAEELIIQELSDLNSQKIVIWLSLHPPFYSDKVKFVENLKAVSNFYYITDQNHKVIDESRWTKMILSDKEMPEWGTDYGNFFEIALLPRIDYCTDEFGIANLK